jgi:hypothetical protein
MFNETNISLTIANISLMTSINAAALVASSSLHQTGHRA